jgi:hypothetical protein
MLKNITSYIIQATFFFALHGMFFLIIKKKFFLGPEFELF